MYCNDTDVLIVRVTTLLLHDKPEDSPPTSNAADLYLRRSFYQAARALFHQPGYTCLEQVGLDTQVGRLLKFVSPILTYLIRQGKLLTRVGCKLTLLVRREV